MAIELIDSMRRENTMTRKCPYAFFVPAVILLGTLFASSLPATEEIAEKVEQDCDFCHISPMGGEELSEVGLSFQRALLPQTAPAKSIPRALGARIFRLLVGYIHIASAFFWFGTILYVHLVLKPSYAVSGLPKGEVRVGVISMVIMAVTGIILTLYRVPTVSALFLSRFGILLVIKVALFVMMVGSGLFAVFCIGPKLRRKASQQLDESKTNFNAEELSQFDGRDGSDVYFACAGTIYDASNSKMWLGGLHAGKHHAGSDLTKALEQAPHGADVFASLPHAGKLTEAISGSTRPWYVTAFYFIAYMNLCIVLLIILILALWRW